MLYQSARHHNRPQMDIQDWPKKHFSPRDIDNSCNWLPQNTATVRGNNDCKGELGKIHGAKEVFQQLLAMIAKRHPNTPWTKQEDGCLPALFMGSMKVRKQDAGLDGALARPKATQSTWRNACSCLFLQVHWDHLKEPELLKVRRTAIRAYSVVAACWYNSSPRSWHCRFTVILTGLAFLCVVLICCG